MSTTITPHDLDAALSDLEKSAAAGPEARKHDLMAKSMRQGLSQAESAELITLMQGGGAVTDLLHKSTTPSGPLKAALDVSEYLDAHHDMLAKSLSTLGDAIDTGRAQQGEFNLVLAKAVHAIGEELRDLRKSLEGDRRPARAPKSGAAPLTKSFAGQPASDSGELSKSQILDTLEALAKSAPNGVVAGENLTNAAAKYEMTNQMSRQLYDAVRQYRQNPGAFQG